MIALCLFNDIEVTHQGSKVDLGENM